MSDFKLSDKICRTERRWNRKPYAHFRYKDVAEFIRLLKEAHYIKGDEKIPYYSYRTICKEIDKLAYPNGHKGEFNG